MRLLKINVSNFRNIKNATLEFSPETTLIYGNNAEGKTNVIEAIYLFAHSKSFRRARERELIMFGEEEARVEAYFLEGKKEARFEIRISRKNGKSFYYNGIKLEKMRDFFGHFLAVLFVPEELKIIKNGPGERRAFIDSALCQIKPVYITLLYSYHKLCEEKNAVLKSYKGTPSEKLMLEVYNEKLIPLSAKITKERKAFVTLIEQKAKEHFFNMSGKDEMSISFLPSGLEKESQDFEKLYKELFEKSLDNDLKLTRVSCGAGFDDIEIKINSISARSFASQGQQRSAVVALKLAEGEVLGELTRRAPIYLFDDILSELDDMRREYILKNLKNKEVIITSCNKNEDTSVYAYLAESGRYTRI